MNSATYFQINATNIWASGFIFVTIIVLLSFNIPAKESYLNMQVTHQNALLNILLADDDLDDRIFFDRALSEISIPTTLSSVSNGEQLMQFLAEHEDQLPDVLFLDLSMPRKTGFECLAEIRENEKFKALTVIMFTTSFTRGIDLEDNLKNTLTRMGAYDYIRKPGDYNELKQVIHQALAGIINKKLVEAETKLTA